jgi:hypothetical protein
MQKAAAAQTMLMSAKQAQAHITIFNQDMAISA